MAATGGPNENDPAADQRRRINVGRAGGSCNRKAPPLPEPTPYGRRRRSRAVHL